MNKNIILILFVFLIAVSSTQADEIVPKVEIVNPEQRDAGVGLKPPAENIISDNDLLKQGRIPVKNVFKNKIVYTMEQVRDLTPLLKDCKIRGGTLKECGSVCDDSKGPVICPAVCAYTCENISDLPLKVRSKINLVHWGGKPLSQGAMRGLSYIISQCGNKIFTANLLKNTSVGGYTDFSKEFQGDCLSSHGKFLGCQKFPCQESSDQEILKDEYNTESCFLTCELPGK